MTEPNAEIISIGTEILLGEIVDTNSVFIAQGLRDCGVNLYYMSSVGDNTQRICDAVKLAVSRSNIVILCGGLGPTIDDMTREAVAKAFDKPLEFHQKLLDDIAMRFETFKVQMTDNNRRQAYLPANAQVIDNPVGTAPAFYVNHNDTLVICLPGVPREMKYLFNNNVVPMLRSRFKLGVIKKIVFHTAGIGESSLDSLIGTDLLQKHNPTIGLAAHHGSVDIRLTAKAATEDEAIRLLFDVQETLLERVGSYVYGKDGESLEDILIDKLNKHAESLVITQIGIHSDIENRINDNSIKVLTYDSLEELYNSVEMSNFRDIAVEVADRQLFNQKSTISIAIVSNPEVDEGRDDEVATAVAITDGNNAKSRVYGFGAKSETAKSWVSNWSLSYVLQMLKDKYDG